MAKLTLTDLSTISGSLDTLNSNSRSIETALENTLSRDGTTPNEMSADFDMNSNDILNAKDINYTGNLYYNGQALVVTEDIANLVTTGVGLNTSVSDADILLAFETRSELVSYWSADKLPDGVLLSAAGLIYVVVTGSTGISDLLGLEPFGEVNVKHFDVTGDGVEDDTIAFSEAVDYVISKGVWLFGNSTDTYKFTSIIEKTGQFMFDGRGAKWLKTTSGVVFKFTATSNTYTLSSDYTKTGTTLLVNDTITALERNQPLLIRSDAVAIDNRDEGSKTSLYRTGEFSFVGDGTTTTTSIDLIRPLQKVIGVNPVSSAGEEATVDAYTTAYNTNITVPDREEKFIFMNFEGEYEDGHGQGSGDLWQGTFLDIIGYVNPIVYNIRQYRGYDSSIRLSGTFWAEVVNCYAERLENNSGDGQLGYAVADAGYCTVVRYCKWVDCRHGYTTGQSTTGTNPSDIQEIYRTAGAVGGFVIGCRASNFVDTSPFDTHHGCLDITFVDCFADYCGGKAFTIRGRRVNVINPRIRRCVEGIYAFTEFDSGDPDDDLTLNLKTADTFTSLYVVNPFIEVEKSPFGMLGARLEIQGTLRVRSASHHLVDDGDLGQGQGSLLIGASGTFTMETFNGSLAEVANNSTGIFYIKKPTSSGYTPAYPTSTIKILKTTDLAIDVADTTSTTLNCIDLDHDDVTFVNRGRIRFAVPADAQFDSATGTITTEHGGEFIVKRTGESEVHVQLDASKPRTFAARSDMVTEFAAYGTIGATVPSGVIWIAEGVTYEYDGVAAYISDMSGWAYAGGKFRSDKTFNIPTDFADWVTALDVLSRVDAENGVTITLNFETGEEIAAGVLIENCDLRHVTITSDDATVSLASGFTGVTVSGAPTQSANAVMALYRAHGPTFGFVVDMGGEDGAGLFVTTNSIIEVSPSCGINDAGRYGVSVSSTSILNADNATFTDADWGNRVTTSSTASLRKANLSGGCSADSEAACLVVSRGSTVDIRGDSGDMTNLSGSSNYGLYVRRSFVSADWVDVSSSGSGGARASHGAHLTFYGGDADSCAIGIASLESWVNAKNATAIGCTDRAVYAEDGGYLNAYGVDGSGSTGTYGARASDGSEINCVDGNFAKSVSDTNDISVKDASTIRAKGATGQLSQTANAIGTNGVIIQ